MIQALKKKKVAWRSRSAGVDHDLEEGGTQAGRFLKNSGEASSQVREASPYS